MVLDPSLIIAWMNDAYLSSTMRQRNDILGRSIFEAFPSDPTSESHQLLKASFDRVRFTKKADEIALIRYDILNPNGSMEVRYWSATHTPLLDADGEISFILQHTVDVTELQSLRTMRDEMGIVQRAQAVQERNQDLAAESERLRALFEQAPGFVAILSGPDHVFQLANEAYRNLVGKRDLAGKSVAEALPEVVEQGFVELLTSVHSSGAAYVGRREKLVLQNDSLTRGRERFLDFLYQPIFTDGGQVSGIFVQGHDVTEQVLAEEHQKLLINELNHRVKNTLAIVQSLATQTFRNAKSLEAARTTFTARMTALASAHSLLTVHNWEAAGLAETVLTAIAATVGSDVNRIRVEGPDTTLPPQAVMSVAMIIHELSTNAIKYGALSVETGRVEVNWTSRPFEGRCEIILNWIERGGPLVAPPERKGFGTRLIQRGISSDLNSDVEMNFAKEGLQCRITAHISIDQT
ncbi:PAS domain-containing protein [Novosphingobium sp. G106]|nr:PAS domain-containing protein [Novosphingobium sp. G106]